MPLTQDEIKTIERILGRKPTQEELAMFEAQWSEHCSYKSSKLLLMWLPTKASHVIIGPGRDAGAIEAFPGIAIVFKIESHNHPSAVDPYNGAATGIGGIVRDILTLGAKPIALLDLLYLGNPKDHHANWLIRNIVKGISDYGNRIGVPTVAGDVWFDSSYNRQPLVNVACIGLVSKQKIVNDKPEPGDCIIIAGNDTGRDGLLGSSFASRPLSSDTDKDIGAVQVGNPLMEKLIIDFLIELVEEGVIKYIKDLGGGGLTTAISEVMADHNLGAEIHLDKLHLREDLTPIEILVSESQERMLLIVNENNLDRVKAILNKYEIPYSVIGRFDKSRRLRVFFKDELVADIPAKELAKPHVIRRMYRPPIEALKGLRDITIPLPRDMQQAFEMVLSSPNVASKRWIYEQYDYEVGIRTVIKPGQGDAAVLRLLDGTKRGIAIKGDANPRYTYLDPFRGAANSVAECFRNLVAVGSEPLAIVDELNAGNPEKPTHFWYFARMVKGIAWMCDELSIPVVGGKVSFYNENEYGQQVKPVATIVGVGKLVNIEKAKSMDFKEPGSYIVVVGITYPELGGSEYLHTVHGIDEGEIPIPRPVAELKCAKLLQKLMKHEALLSAHDVSVGGLATSIAEMSVQGMLGVDVDLSKAPIRTISRLDELMFSESQARYILEIHEGKLNLVLKETQDLGIEVGVLGKVVDNGKIIFRYLGKTIIDMDLQHVHEVYTKSLDKLMR